MDAKRALRVLPWTASTAEILRWHLSVTDAVMLVACAAAGLLAALTERVRV